MPYITCVPTKPLPPPPPPSPPQPPPSPPPFIAIERSDCFLGGRAVFTITPSETPGLQWGAMSKTRPILAEQPGLPAAHWPRMAEARGCMPLARICHCGCRLEATLAELSAGFFST